MKDRKLATRYARALLASLGTGHEADSADHFLSAIRLALEESAEFRDLMLDPAVPASARIAVLRKLAADNQMPTRVGNFLETIVQHNRAGSLSSIAVVYHEELQQASGIVPAEIVTATPLTEELKQRTLQALEKLTGQKVRLTEQVDPELIGGAVTTVGSTVYDGSLRTQLSKLRKQMTQE